MTKCSCGYRDKDKCNKESGLIQGKMCLKENISTTRTPKIKWHVERNMYRCVWYTIIAEVSLGSARYAELHTISQEEINELRYISTLWKIIEKMQGNMLGALGYYEAQTTQIGSADDIQHPHCYLCLAPLPRFGTVAISYLCSRCKRDVYGVGD